MAKKAKKPKTAKRKKPAKKSLKLRKKALRDLPAKKTSTKVKGGRANLQSTLDAGKKVQEQIGNTQFAPSYVPVKPEVQVPRI